MSAATPYLQYPQDGFSTYSTSVELAYRAEAAAADQAMIEQIRNKSLEAWMFTDHSGSMTDYSDPISGVFGSISSQIRNENVTTGSESMLYSYDADFIQATIDLYISRIQANFNSGKKYHIILVGDGGEEYLNLSLQYPLYKSLNLSIHFLQFGPGPASWGSSYVVRNNQAVGEIIRAANQTGGGYRDYSGFHYTEIPAHTDEIKTEILKMISAAGEPSGSVPAQIQNATCALMLDSVVLSNKTASNGTIEKIQTANLSVGTHYWKVDCAGIGSQTWRFEVLEAKAASVELKSPADGMRTYLRALDFDYTYHKGSGGADVERCDFYYDNSIVANINSTDGAVARHRVLGMQAGKHSWKVLCAGAMSAEWNFEVIVPTAPKVELLSPKDGHATREHNINFSFVYANGSFEPELAQCDYILDGLVGAKSPAQSLIPANIGIFGIPTGAHAWSVRCGSATSDEWKFSVLAPVRPKVSLLSPEDSFVSMSPDIDFSYVYSRGSDAPIIGECELVLDGLAKGLLLANDSIPISLQLRGISPGDHNWSVACNKGEEYEAISEEWHFFYLPDKNKIEANGSRNASNPPPGIAHREFNASGGIFGSGGKNRSIVNVSAPNESKVLRQYRIQIFEEDDITPIENLEFAVHKQGSNYMRVERTGEDGIYFFIPLEEGLYYYSVPGHGMKRNTTTQVSMDFVEGIGFYEIGEAAGKNWALCLSTCGLLLLLLLLLAMAHKESRKRRKARVRKVGGLKPRNSSREA